MIVIDGASRDSTRRLVEAVPARVRLIAEPDEGIYDAMNKGISAAQGDHLWFLNGGDEAIITWSELASVLRNHRDAVVLGDYVLAGKQFDVPRRSRAPRSMWHALPTSHQAIFYPRARVGALRYDSRFGIVADYAFTAEMYSSHVPFVRAARAVARFHLDGVSTSQALLIGRQAGVVQRDILRVPRVKRLASGVRHRLNRRLRQILSGRAQ